MNAPVSTTRIDGASARARSEAPRTDGSQGEGFERLLKGDAGEGGGTPAEASVEGDRPAEDASTSKKRIAGRFDFERLLSGAEIRLGERTRLEGEGAPDGHAEADGANAAPKTSSEAAPTNEDADRLRDLRDLAGSVLSLSRAADDAEAISANRKAAAPEIPAAALPGTGAKASGEPRLENDMVETVRFGLGRAGTASGDPKSAGPSRVDVVSMRTDFQPAELSVNGAKGAGAVQASLAQTQGPLGGLVNAKIEGVSEGGADPHSVALVEDGEGEGAFDIAPKSVTKAIEPNSAFGREIGAVIAGNLGESDQGRSGALPQASATQRSFGPDGERLRYQAGGAALKTLQIQLHPAHFGKLDVIMKVVEGQMTLHLTVSEPETLLRLQDDREGLKSVLTGAGFDVDDAAMTIALRDGPSATRANAPQPDPSHGSRQDAAMSNNGEAGQSRREGAGHQDHGRRNRGGEDTAPPAANGPGAGGDRQSATGVYL